MQKRIIRILNDLVMLLSFIFVSLSGFVLWKVLPRGSGRTGAEFILAREGWLAIHDYGALILTLTVILHVIFYWRVLSSTIISSWRQKNE